MPQYELVDKSGVVVAWIGSFGPPQGITVADLQSDRDDSELFRATLDD